ncbi:MAG TPA: tetratricopeptide repeat protein [Burkholderiales bacterium]|nr:tetratricopeptide repeat protein [Burkholderiales bacterium]
MNTYERAWASLRLQRGDARALAAAAVAAQPEALAPRLLEAALLVTSRYVHDFEAAGRAYDRLRDLPMSGRERAHTSALQAAVDGDYELACLVYDRILLTTPTDALALWTAQLMDYYLGNAAAMRERSGRVLAGWSVDMPGYHAVLSMHAFALQECGDYGAAEEAALRALELEPRDLRAQHTLMHVYEMVGQPEEGMRWAGRHASQWCGDAAVAHHLWWHTALFMTALERPQGALAIYDLRLQQDSLSGMIDASALLWRLHLERFDVGARFATLAGRWAAHAEDAYCAFNDLHAMMAFAGAERWDLAQRLLAAQERRIGRPGANRDMTRLVGYPACRALLAFGRGDFRTAEALLRSLPPVAHRIGGSHAQRDVLQLTRAAALAQRSSTRTGATNVFALPQRLAAA